MIFQSTLPAWGETGKTPDQLRRMAISIHSPRMGRDMTHDQKLAALVKFQSTLPAWGETTDKSAEEGNRNISIHSPRMGRDSLT